MKRSAHAPPTLAARVVTLVLALLGAGAALVVVSVALSYLPWFQEFLVWLTTHLP